MSVVRKALRALVRDALMDDGHFADFSGQKSWGRSVNEKELPQLALFTPRFDVESAGAGKRLTTFTLQIAVRRTGGADLEDELDDDADAIERVALPILDAACHDAELISGENDVPGIGEGRIGTLALTFRCTVLSDRPA